MRVIDFRGEHLKELQELGGQQWLKRLIEYDNPKKYEDLGPSFTATYDGEIVGCAGLEEIHETRAMAWCIMDMECSKHMLEIHMAVLDWLRRKNTYKRVEAYVDPDFKNAMKWVKLLKFKQNGEEMKHFFPGGKSAICFEYIKEH